MKNQTFTRADGSRPGKRRMNAKEIENEPVRARILAFVNDYKDPEGKPPLVRDIATGVGVTYGRAQNIIKTMRDKNQIPRAGRRNKTPQTNIHTGSLRTVVCIECKARTCARSETSETLRGWVGIDIAAGVGVCHKCSKAQLAGPGGDA